MSRTTASETPALFSGRLLYGAMSGVQSRFAPPAFAPYSPRFVFGQARNNETGNDRQFVELLAETSHVAIFDDGSTHFRKNRCPRSISRRKLGEVICTVFAE